MYTIKKLYAAVEEYNPIVLDKFERFRSYLSRNPDKMEPVLSRYLFNNGFRPIYKDDKKFAVCFSHDVDYMYDDAGKKRHFINSIKSLKNRDIASSVYNVRSIIKSRLNPDWSLDRFIDLENKHHIPATYYFLALDENEEDHNYPIASMAPFFKKIKEAGSEIGLHGGHAAFNSKEKIASERQKLENAYGEQVRGYRNHYLRFKTPDTWEHLEKLGFVYDTTFGFADLPGYRNGMCYPYRPFNYEKNAFIDVLELPLIVMDVTFWKYMGLTVDQSFVLFKKIVKDIKSINGVLTVLWHNNCLLGEEGVLYKKIFEFLVSDEEAWFTNSMELALFWKDKNGPLMEEIIKANFESIISE